MGSIFSNDYKQRVELILKENKLIYDLFILLEQKNNEIKSLKEQIKKFEKLRIY